MDNIVILCAGSGSRAALGYNKIFYPLGKGCVLDTVIGRFEGLGRIILVVSKNDKQKISKLYPDFTIVEGGNTRTASVRNALDYLKNHNLCADNNSDGCIDDNIITFSKIGKSNASLNQDVLAIHDAARPFVPQEVILDALNSARKTGSGIPAVRSVDSTVTAADGKIKDSLKKEDLYCLQTPQCFRLSEIIYAYDKVQGDFADDSEVYKKAGYSPTLTSGSYKNKKLTTPEDFIALHPYEVGAGFDVHPLTEGRPLILGGVNIPYYKGLDGHSDADVVAHALTDAVLSAAMMPDIGVLFPDTDPSYKGIDSMKLLDKALELLRQKGREVVSASLVIIAQKPKLAPLIPSIKESLANRLGINASFVNISATTTEFLGIVGEGRAIASSATVLFRQVTPLTE